MKTRSVKKTHGLEQKYKWCPRCKRKVSNYYCHKLDCRKVHLHFPCVYTPFPPPPLILPPEKPMTTPTKGKERGMTTKADREVRKQQNKSVILFLKECLKKYPDNWFEHFYSILTPKGREIFESRLRQQLVGEIRGKMPKKLQDDEPYNSWTSPAHGYNGAIDEVLQILKSYEQ